MKNYLLLFVTLVLLGSQAQAKATVVSCMGLLPENSNVNVRLIFLNDNIRATVSKGAQLLFDNRVVPSDSAWIDGKFELVTTLKDYSFIFAVSPFGNTVSMSRLGLHSDLKCSHQDFLNSLIP